VTTARIALVTGANKSMGREIARQLGALGNTVWLGCRDEGRGRQAEGDLRGSGINAHVVELDITDDASVRAAAARVAAESGHLVGRECGNRGRPCPRSSEEDVAEIRAVFDINVVGAIRVIQAFLLLLRKSDSARIVMLTIWGVAAMGYAASKTTLKMITVKLAKELLAEGIKVNAACPGDVATDLDPHFGIRSVKQVREVLSYLPSLTRGARPAAFFTTAKVPALCGMTGKFLDLRSRRINRESDVGEGNVK
jgi:NAD(P)-dependent dehydrogenase (short-subunit alcohol dehydrogenase family)